MSFRILYKGQKQYDYIIVQTVILNGLFKVKSIKHQSELIFITNDLISVY